MLKHNQIFTNYGDILTHRSAAAAAGVDLAKGQFLREPSINKAHL